MGPIVISKSHVVATLLLLVVYLPSLQLTEAQIGVCYGMSGNNLPSKQDVIKLYKSMGVARMRLYGPHKAALQALRGSSIGLILDVPRAQIVSLGSSTSAATTWIQNNVVSYVSNINFRYIAVGNEIMPSDSESSSVLPAMQNVYNALRSANLTSKIKVSTAIASELVTGFPPSDGAFTSSSFINPIVNFLKNNDSPLLANIYPYFSYTSNPSIVKLEYALFTSPIPLVNDSKNGLKYQNLFDAIVDTMYAALAKAGAPNTRIVVSESGWPSGGNSGYEASFDIAGQYYKGLIGHVKQGTPLKKGKAIETYLFAMFDENQKGGGVENNFGLFTPDRKPKYQQLNFTN